VIDVVHAPRPKRDAADDEIVRRVRAAPYAGDVRVVTSDRALADLARAAGASVEPAEPFRSRIDAL
jgi:uncharacterized protein YaiI (UPF0178 family)